MQNKKNKIITSFAISAVVAIVFIATATVLGELYKPFKNWLADTFYHHWMGKGIIAIVIFYVLGLFGKASDNEDKMVKMLRILFWIAVIGVIVITVFYLYEYFIVAH